MTTRAPDPWLEESYLGLEILLEATLEGPAPSIGVAVVADEEDGATCLERLARRWSVRELHLGTADHPVQALESWLTWEVPEEPIVQVLRGLSGETHGPAAGEVWSYLNLHREAIHPAGTALILVIDSETLPAWLRAAPDLHRYAQTFDLVDWGRVADLWLDRYRRFGAVYRGFDAIGEEAADRARRAEESGAGETAIGLLVDAAELSFRSRGPAAASQHLEEAKRIAEQGQKPLPLGWHRVEWMRSLAAGARTEAEGALGHMAALAGADHTG